MTMAGQGRAFPKFFEYFKAPVKLVETPDGGLAAWRVSRTTGGWEQADQIIDDLLLGEGEVNPLSQDRFVQRTERYRARHLSHRTGPVYALYGTVRAVIESAVAERRVLTAEEGMLVQETLRRTFVMFEEQLLRAGDPGADPTLVA